MQIKRIQYKISVLFTDLLSHNNHYRLMGGNMGTNMGTTKCLKHGSYTLSFPPCIRANESHQLVIRNKPFQFVNQVFGVLLLF